MSQILTQNQAADLVVILTDSSNVPVTGLTFSDVTADYRKEGQGSFTSYTLDGTNFTEIGDGVYTIGFTTSEIDTVGTFTVKVNGASIQQYVTIANVLAAGTSPTIETVNTCVINGHVFDADGSALEGAAISARVIASPTLLNDIALSRNSVTATTDANGEFFLSLAQLAEVEIFIPSVNYRRQLTVPASASVNLFTGIP